MAFTLEDGTQIVDANAYVSRTYVASYHADRGRAAWALIADEAVENACIIRASEYVDKRFGPRFRGTKRTRDQGLEWPRHNAYDDDGHHWDAVPSALKKAVAEYALRAAILGELAPDAPRPTTAQTFETLDAAAAADAQTGLLKSKSVSVGGGAVSTKKTYDNFASMTTNSSRADSSSVVNSIWLPEYPEADMWVEELLKSSSSTRLVRGD